MAKQDRAFPDMTLKQEQALKEEARFKCLEDLYYLAKHILGYNRLTEHCHRRMAMDIDTPRYRFRLLLWPRGHFKSTIGTEARSIQKLLRNPNERILITNAKLDNARKFLRAIAHHWNGNPKFRWVWRQWWLDKYSTPFHRAEYGNKLDWVVRDTQDEFIILRPYEGREASITPGSTEASLVSQHYSTIIADDLINRDFVSTPEMIQKSILYFKDLLDLLDPQGDLEIIGTRWHHTDLYSWIIEEFGGVASLRVPEGFVKKEVVEQSHNTPEEKKEWMISIQPCYDEDGKPIFPEEFNAEVLKNLEHAKGPYEFGAQYRLNPTPREGQRFREEWFNHLDVLPSPSNLQVCITVDPAKSLKDRADSTAIVAYGYDTHNNMFLLDGIDEKLDIEELPEALFTFVQKWKGMAKYLFPVGFEAVGFQETYIHTLERMMLEKNYFFAIEPIKRRTQSKEERILRLVPRVKNGFYVPRRLVVTPFNPRNEPYDLVMKLKWQLLNFPFAGHDDLADATADQLDIVKAHGLPKQPEAPVEQRKRDFTHRSLLEDRRGPAHRRRDTYTGAVR